MTIKEAITQTREQKPNPYSDANLKVWLSIADGQIFKYLQGFEDLTEAFDGYDALTDDETELLAEHPFDALYIDWLKSKIDVAMEEYERYNIDATLFNEGLNAYTRYIVQRRTPRQDYTIVWPRL